MSKDCDRCKWVVKYGIDFLKNYGPVNYYSLSKFLNVNLKNIKYDYIYKELREKFESKTLSK